MDDSGWAIAIIVAVLLGALFYFLPSIIAFNRDHSYKWVILAINTVAGASGIGWLIAMVWAVYPQERSLADPVIGNPTGTGERNVGHTMAEVRAASGTSSGAKESSADSPIDAIAKLASLAKEGVITDEEFARKRTDLLSRV